ncbi:MAG: hypothetical protein RJA98_3850 [Pseudomonadota bacterium]|jgi:Asp/Glu/hydantoin racemase
MTPDLLVLNPNTTPAVTERVAQALQQQLGDTARVHSATARFGGHYIASELSYGVAGHAVPEAYMRHVIQHGVPRAVLLACFGDPGAMALRELTTAPVMGLAEAALRAADARFKRYAIVTGGPAWVPMLQRFARAHQLGQGLVQIEALTESGAELAADPERAVQRLVQACNAVAGQVDGIILGGAGLAGFAPAVRERINLPMIDSVEAGIAWVQAQLPSLGGEPPSVDIDAWRGLVPQH